MTDFYELQALRDIYSTYGAEVSFREKAKSLRKFGRTVIGASNTTVTVAEFQDSVVQETYATSNSIDYAISTSASDTGVATIEGHYLSGTDLVFHVQTVTLTGQTKAALSQPLVRSTRIGNFAVGTIASPTAAFIGDVAVFDNTLNGDAFTAGKPDVDASVKVMLRGTIANTSNSFKGATALSSTDFWAISSLVVSVERSAGNPFVDFWIEQRRIGGAWRRVSGADVTVYGSGQPSAVVPLLPWAIIGPNSDVRVQAVASAACTVHATIEGPLARQL